MRVATAAVLAASALLLAGCQSAPSPTGSASASGGPTASHSPSSAPKVSSTPKPKPTPVTLKCDQVLTSAQVSALAPPLSPASGFKPDKGSDAAKALSYAGVACGYTNASTGHTVSVAIARPAASDLTELKNKAITDSHVVPTYGVPPKVMGYFTVDASVGVAEAFTGDYWVVAESKDFIEPGDAAPVIADVLGNLPG